MSESLRDKNTESGLLVTMFFVGNARFGIDADRVQEVVQVRKTTLVHHAPGYVRGVMNLRGRVVTVIDLGEKLALGPIEKDENNRILIVDWKQEHVGLLVDRVAEVVQVEHSAVRQPPGNVHGVQAELISGVFQEPGGNLAGLLAIEEVLNVDEDDTAGVASSAAKSNRGV